MALSDLLYTRAGRFNRPVQIQQQITGVDSFGQPIALGWTVFKTGFAEILPFVGEISGFSIKPAPDTATAPCTINVRYGLGKDVTKGMRVVHKTTGTIYQILYVGNPETAQKVIQFACQLVTP